MESKDFQLLVALHEDARQSFRALGDRLSLSHGVVHERLKHLERLGILQGFLLSVDPGVLDRDDLIVWFEGDWTLKDAERALAAPDVAWVALKVDGDLTVQLWPRDRPQAVKSLEGAVGANASGQFVAKGRRHPPPSLVDWRIIDALIDDPRMPLKDLVGETRLSPKTVSKHLETLVRNGTISIAPKIGALADSGELVYTCSVFGNVGMNELHGMLEDAFLIKQFDEPPAKYLLCRGRDLNEVTGKTYEIEKFPGVDSVSITLISRFLSRTEFVHSLVRDRIQNLERAR